MVKERIALYDALKGFSILWIVAFHIPAFASCDVLRVYYAVPLFFVVSGVFFRAEPFAGFVAKKARRLLRPLGVFYAVAYGAYMLGAVIKGAGPFSWSEPAAVLDLFRWHNAEPLSPLAINYPLWFLLVLFNVGVLYYGLAKGIAKVGWRWVVAAGGYVLGAWLDERGVNGVLFLSLTLRYLFYFTVGHTVVPRLVEWLHTPQRRAWTGVGAAVLLAGCTAMDRGEWFSVLFVARVLLFGVVAGVVIGFLIDRMGWLKRGLTFFGVHSMVVLGLHTVVIWGWLGFGLGGGFGSGWVLWGVDCAVCAAAAVAIDRWVPWILGTTNIKQ